MATSQSTIDRNFDYHAPTPEKVRDHEMIRTEFKELAEILVGLPQGREAALAMTNLEQAMFWANAAIAREGK